MLAGERMDSLPLHSYVRRVGLTLALTLLSAVLALVVVIGINVLLAAFAGLLFAVMLNAGARATEDHTPLGYGLALTLLVVIIVAVLVGAGWLLAPQVAEQADELAQVLPVLLADIEAFLAQYGWGQWLLQRLQDGEMADGAIFGAGGGVLASLSNVSTYLLVAVFVGLFAAANPGLYVEGTVSLTPLRHRERMREVLAQLGHTLRWWLVGQAASMVIIGVSTGLVLWAFDVPLAIVLGIIVGLLGFIPYIGPILGTLPVAMIAATQGADTLLYVLLAYAAVQMLEGYVAVPLIHERTVYLAPVFTIVIQIILGVVIGMMGIIMATPLAAVLLVMSRFYRRDFLGDPDAREQLAAN
jgi:predicted PurR-regulated permease PerM